MRVVKEHEVRRKEILDTSERLFIAKGYDKTTINDILNEIGIAKGTFYHYFKSKEEVMDAIIARIVEKDVADAKKIAEDVQLNPCEKFLKILIGIQSAEEDSKTGLTEQLNRPDNAQMHQKGVVQSIKNLSPILAQVVEQGIEQGVFATDFPLESVEFLLSSGQVIFDEGMFRWSNEERIQRAKAFSSIMEKILGVPKDSFNFMLDVLAN